MRPFFLLCAIAFVGCGHEEARSPSKPVKRARVPALPVEHSASDLRSALTSDNMLERLPVLIEIAEMECPPPEYLPELIENLTWKSESPDTMSQELSVALNGKATQALVKMGKPAVPNLQRLLHDTDVMKRWQAIEVLERMGEPALAALPDIIETLDDNKKQIRYYAAKTLMQFGDRAKDAVPALIRHIADDHDSARHFSIKALGEIGKAAEPALPALNNATNHEDLFTRMYAKDAVKKITLALKLNAP